MRSDAYSPFSEVFENTGAATVAEISSMPPTVSPLMICLNGFGDLPLSGRAVDASLPLMHGDAVRTKWRSWSPAANRKPISD
ncbi:hypothetical protein GCM10017083_32990 [Thalassobaculum fulvum]|uniref:Uncharacterized protein n=1 Tax=Thalassobaculum fulvum TaxID=1633335 RepID=A0A918XTR5_9PROT|nr:hypothetical protein GCM10017083_32990 [Thalassobaculum fulvum]